MAVSSVVLHGAVLAVLLWQTATRPDDPPPEPATVQVEYINQAAAIHGAADPDHTADPADEPAQAPQQAAEPTPPPPNTYEDVPMPPPGMPSDAAAFLTRQTPVNLGIADDDHDSLSVTGDNVVSSGPDAAFRNMPPNYPQEAVRAHQQGSVQVLVHVTPAGVAGDVETVISSGIPVLDNAVRDAVLKWHFKPALRDGAPVASVFQLQMNFRSQNP